MSANQTNTPDPGQIPYMIRLLDDESEEVRQEIIRGLASFGPALKAELKKLPAVLIAEHERALEKIIFEQSRYALVKAWPSWPEQNTDIERLEMAFSILAEFQGGLRNPYDNQSLTPLLDRLAEEYRGWAQTNDPLELARFLFEYKGLTGAQNDYYHPQNSNLLYVLHEKKGLPISLSCIFILVAARLGFEVQGYNFPGHFMCKVNHGEKNYLVDGFNGGKVLEDKAVTELSDGVVSLDDRGYSPVGALEIIRRVLNNLISAYQAGGQSDHQQLMIELYRTIQPD